MWGLPLAAGEGQARGQLGASSGPARREASSGNLSHLEQQIGKLHKDQDALLFWNALDEPHDCGELGTVALSVSTLERLRCSRVAAQQKPASSSSESHVASSSSDSHVCRYSQMDKCVQE